MTDPFDGRTEMSAEEYRSWLASGGQTLFVPALPVEVVPDWQASEKAFQQKVSDYAREHGWRVYHTFKSASSEPGFPDLVMLRRGVERVAELKVQDNKPTKAQREWLNDYAEVGGQTYVHLWYPDDWDEIQEVLR